MVGCFAFDQGLFEEIEQFILKGCKHDRDAGMASLWMMSFFGMGIDEPVTDDEFDTWWWERSGGERAPLM